MEFKVDVKYNDHDLGVEGRIIAPSVPAIRTGHPDNWAPAEGGEVEITDIYMRYTDPATGKTNSRRCPRSVVERYNLDDIFNEVVCDAINASEA